MPAPMNARNMTGATRYRNGWFGRLILQVEETYKLGHAGRPRLGEASATATRWRDATARDLYPLEWFDRQRSRVVCA